MWNAQNASHIHTASTAATGSNPMPNQNSTNNLPDFQFRKVRKKLDTTKLQSGQFRLYSRKKDAVTGKRRNLGTFSSLEKAKQHEREVQYFKRH